MSIAHIVSQFTMRAKLTHDGKWVDVNPKEALNKLQVITPNGHILQLCNMVHTLGFENLPFDNFEKFCMNNNISKNSQTEYLQMYPFCEYHVYVLDNDCYYFSCMVTGSIPQTRHSNLESAFNDIIYYLNTTLINRVLEYDRECERTKALQQIGNFCAQFGGMKDLLEFTQGVVNIVTEKQKEKEKETI